MQPRKFTYFEETANKLDITGSELAKAIGYSSNSWFRWRREGPIPQVAGLACECLQRRVRKNGRADTLVMNVPEAQVQAMTAICRGMDIEVLTLNGAS